MSARFAWLSAASVVLASGLGLLAIAGEQTVSSEALLNSAEKRGQSLISSGLPKGPSLEAMNADLIPGAVVQRDEDKRVRYIYGKFATTGKTPEARAEHFLRSRADVFGLSATLAELRHRVTQQSLTGTHVRYEQVYAGLPVVDGSLSVHMDFKGNVLIVNNDLVSIDSDRSVAKTADSDNAVSIAVNAVGALGAPMRKPMSAPGVYVHEGVPFGITRVMFETGSPAADWDVFVDNQTGEVLHARNRACYVDGQGLVYDPSPVVTSGIANLTDNNDQTNATLDAQRFSRTLPGLDGSGRLEGPFVTTTPTVGQARALEPSLIFNYNRFDDRFEEVMCYYHLDRSQRYIQSLGFNNVNNRKQGVDVNGTTADNSFYSPSTKHVTFGTGGVDDAEDSDVILHEYGHSIHDNQVPGWGSSFEARAMGEGFGDYWAGSESAGVGPMAPQWDPYIAEWDGVSYNPGNPAFLRRLDTTKVYPTNMTNSSVHADGEIWSAALWQMRAAIGRARADRLVLEHHFYLGTGASYPQAANAVLLANQNLYAGADQAAIRQVFINRGILQILSAPGNLTATAVNANRIDLTWVDTNSDETGHRVERKVAGGAFQEIAVLGANVTSYQSTGLAANTSYVFRVRAFMPEGNSPYSNEAGASTPYQTHSISGVLSAAGGVGIAGIQVHASGIGNSLHSQSVSPGLSIPDNNQTGVTSNMVVTQSGTIQSVRVGVNITHTWIGDLEVTLVHPDGTTVRLHNRTGGSADNIVTSYPDLTAPDQSLNVLNGKPLNGTWGLRIRDLAAQDVGVLNNWSITVVHAGKVSRMVKSGPGGAFSFTDLAPGTYEVYPQDPKRGGVLWTPKARTVVIGPDATGVNFTRN